MSNARIMLARKNKFVQGVKSIAPDASVFTALLLMKRFDIGSLVVMREGCFLGIITERDIVRKVEAEGRTSKETLVADIYTCCDKVVSVPPEATREDCLHLMKVHGIRHLPVIEGEGEYEKVIGVISIRDILEEYDKRGYENDQTRQNLPRS